jgi:hypothetical protein
MVDFRAVGFIGIGSINAAFPAAVIMHRFEGVLGRRLIQPLAISLSIVRAPAGYNFASYSHSQERNCWSTPRSRALGM